jgi:hypothetical protein
VHELGETPGDLDLIDDRALVLDPFFARHPPSGARVLSRLTPPSVVPNHGNLAVCGSACFRAGWTAKADKNIANNY